MRLQEQNLAPSDYYLFSKLKKVFKRVGFSNNKHGSCRNLDRKSERTMFLKDLEALQDHYIQSRMVYVK